MSRLNGLAGLLKLNARLPVAPTNLMEALALHLDVANDSRSPAQQAWSVLAQILDTAAKLVVDLEVKSFVHRCRVCSEFAAGFGEDVNVLRIFASGSSNM